MASAWAVVRMLADGVGQPAEHDLAPSAEQAARRNIVAGLREGRRRQATTSMPRLLIIPSHQLAGGKRQQRWRPAFGRKRGVRVRAGARLPAPICLSEGNTRICASGGPARGLQPALRRPRRTSGAAATGARSTIGWMRANGISRRLQCSQPLRMRMPSPAQQVAIGEVFASEAATSAPDRDQPPGRCGRRGRRTTAPAAAG